MFPLLSPISPKSSKFFLGKFPSVFSHFYSLKGLNNGAFFDQIGLFKETGCVPITFPSFHKLNEYSISLQARTLKVYHII